MRFCLDVSYAEAKPTEKKKLSEKIKEKENLQRKKQEELRKQVSWRSNNLLILSTFNSHCGFLFFYFAVTVEVYLDMATNFELVL